MDPDANLKEQREIVNRMLGQKIPGAAAWGELERLAELVQALDEWISKGGFLPKAWSGK